jgi:hypothetical protein
VGGAVRPVEVRAAAEQRARDQRPHELHRVDVEEHHEQQDAGDRAGELVVEAVAAEIVVVAPPDLEEHREADGEGEEAAHRVRQFGEGSRHLQRDDEQGHRKGEHRVTEAFDPRDLEMSAREWLLRGAGRVLCHAVAHSSQVGW